MTLILIAKIIVKRDNWPFGNLYWQPASRVPRSFIGRLQGLLFRHSNNVGAWLQICPQQKMRIAACSSPFHQTIGYGIADIASSGSINNYLYLPKKMNSLTAESDGGYRLRGRSIAPNI